MNWSATFLDGRVTLHAGDCLDVLRGLADASIDSVVTDPPYALVSIVKRFGKAGAKPTKDGDVYTRASAGFMGKNWDTGERAFAVEFWADVLRVLKPGGHVVAFSGARTYHRLAVAIEDAGFEIRDQVMWLYGSGFPKSHDVSKGIDKRRGARREPIGKSVYQSKRPRNARSPSGCFGDGVRGPKTTLITAPATAFSRAWHGWGTALKPAHEPIVLARKPLDGSVVETVLRHGTGAINVDGCRIGGGGAARWPANVAHDGSDDVRPCFPDDGAGSAARFFYSAKADSYDRVGSKHPTVKPVDLMQWLCRLVTPPGGVILDPFAGTGTTGEAAWREGFSAVLIEREEEYRADIARRMELAKAGPATRKAESAKARGRAVDLGPLFEGDAA